ncbi:uncharacterized protein LOC143293863 [Babylonia areolata]|uniref:uncharacterized protein LOC143293863 n=1 Tax=Babylonia areolata TaxID=304850 RepID=UPI003FD16D83
MPDVVPVNDKDEISVKGKSLENNTSTVTLNKERPLVDFDANNNKNTASAEVINYVHEQQPTISITEPQDVPSWDNCTSACALGHHSEGDTKDSVTFSVDKVGMDKMPTREHVSQSAKVTTESRKKTVRFSVVRTRTEDRGTVEDEKGSFEEQMEVPSKDKQEPSEINMETSAEESSVDDENLENEGETSRDCADNFIKKCSYSSEGAECKKLCSNEPEDCVSGQAEPNAEDKSVLTGDNAVAAGKSSVKPGRDLHNPISVNFEFEVVQTMECLSCHALTRMTERFTCLMLDIPEKIDGASLQDAVEGFFKKEEVDFKCDHCQQHQKAEVSRKFQSLPRVLIVYLKRYNELMEKVLTPIRLPPRISLRDFCCRNHEPPPSFHIDRSWFRSVKCPVTNHLPFRILKPHEFVPESLKTYPEVEKGCDGLGDWCVVIYIFSQAYLLFLL